MKKIKKVMWLLNHKTLMPIELKILKHLGVEEVFIPKSYPYDEANLSATVTYDYDSTLTVGERELDILNSQNWYKNPSQEAWKIANAHFDIIIIGFFPEQIMSAARNFKHGIILRAFGLVNGFSYSDLLPEISDETLISAISKCGNRFFFGMGYEHLSNIEKPFLSENAVHLPVGLDNTDREKIWEGKNNNIYFVCPRIETSPYYKNIYDKFSRDFAGFDYLIGGYQPLKVNDSKVLGYVDDITFEAILRNSKVMFYHSQEKNHIHYHPFEAIAIGMPLLYMGGGLLDRLGGISLPGRCRDITEAKAKVKKIFKNDKKFIKEILDTQPLLLESLAFDRCLKQWGSGLNKIETTLAIEYEKEVSRPEFLKKKTKKIAVILPELYLGGTLRGCNTLIDYLQRGARLEGQDVVFTFMHLDSPIYSNLKDDGFFVDVPTRAFQWKELTFDEAFNTMYLSGVPHWRPSCAKYLQLDDRINNASEFDLLIFISDRVNGELISNVPYITVVYDYIQRYYNFINNGKDDLNWLSFTRKSRKVLVTTSFTQKDAVEYAGIRADKIKKIPMLLSGFTAKTKYKKRERRDYFVWTTNLAKHKNHRNALLALLEYYVYNEGELTCYVTGVDSDKLLNSSLVHLLEFNEIYEQNKILKEKIKFMGKLPSKEYEDLLGNARFLWHPASIDNGTFAVIEAASYFTPSLASDYPAMREIDENYSLNISWTTCDDITRMATDLKNMEKQWFNIVKILPDSISYLGFSEEDLARQYWKEIEECL